MRILVIEDDPNLKDQIKQSLEDSGYSVDSANDGEEGHFLGDTEPRRCPRQKLLCFWVWLVVRPRKDPSAGTREKPSECQ